MRALVKFLKGVFFILLFLIVAACTLYFYARFIEPRRVEITQTQVKSSKLSQPLRIVAIADTHIGNGMDSGRLAGLMAKVAAQEPDVVVFLGDLFDNYSAYREGEEDEIARIMSLEQLPGVIKLAVYGNHDLGGKAKGVFDSILEKAGYRLLVNSVYETGGVRFVGSDDLIFGKPDVDGLKDGEQFHVLLVHEPDFADRVEGFDLQLSGHTHGGQVRLPLVGPFVLPQWGRIYISGMYQKAEAEQIYVTRGLGMSQLPFRFAARPEITVIELMPS